MATSYNPPDPRCIKICPACPGLRALENVPLSWVPGTKYKESLCSACGAPLLICQKISLYDSFILDDRSAKRVKICTVCPSNQTGLSVSWSGSIWRHKCRRDCKQHHDATVEFVAQHEVQRLEHVASQRRELSPSIVAAEKEGGKREWKQNSERANWPVDQGENQTSPIRVVNNKRKAFDEGQSSLKQPTTCRPEGDVVPKAVNEGSQIALPAIPPLKKAKKTFDETRLDIALAIASKVASQTTPEDGPPALDFFGPVFTSPPPRISASKRRTSEFVFTARNERTFDKLTAPRRVSFADYVEFRDESGRKSFMKENTWNNRPGAGMIDRRLIEDRKGEFVTLPNV